MAAASPAPPRGRLVLHCSLAHARFGCQVEHASAVAVSALIYVEQLCMTNPFVELSGLQVVLFCTCCSSASTASSCCTSCLRGGGCAFGGRCGWSGGDAILFESFVGVYGLGGRASWFGARPYDALLAFTLCFAESCFVRRALNYGIWCTPLASTSSFRRVSIEESKSRHQGCYFLASS